MRGVGKAATLLALVSLTATAADGFLELTEKRYLDADGRLGVVVLAVNWGRQWRCAGYDSAQLQKLIFTRFEDGRLLEGQRSLVLKIPRKLDVDDEYRTLAVLVEPGTYALSEFDVKTARSIGDVGHWVATSNDLIKSGMAVAGTFTVTGDEIIYIGHFSLDCNKEVIPWRYHLQDRNEFEKYVAGLREAYPFISDRPVEFRLFQTRRIGRPFYLNDPVVEVADLR